MENVIGSQEVGYAILVAAGWLMKAGRNWLSNYVSDKFDLDAKIVEFMTIAEDSDMDGKAKHSLVKGQVKEYVKSKGGSIIGGLASKFLKVDNIIKRKHIVNFPTKMGKRSL